VKLYLLALLLGLALLTPSAAEGCVPTTSEADVAAGGFYVDDITSCSSPHWCHGACIPGGGSCVHSALWFAFVYEESNGIAGLQRYDGLVDDTCRGQIQGDTVHY